MPKSTGSADIYMSKSTGSAKKYLFLLILVLQNSALILTLHYTRVTPVKGKSRYLTSTAIFLAEVMKLAVALGFSLHDQASARPGAPILSHFKPVFISVFAGDSWKLTVPAVLYTLQSSLLYTAISNLDVVTFQVNYQLKILTTAVFSVHFLGRQLSPSRWLALVLLAFGIAIVQVPQPNELLRFLNWEVPSKLFSRAAAAPQNGVGEPVMNASKGFAAVVAASVISGLTGVYFEKVVKDSAASVSIWTRNMQLSFYSLFPALFFGVLYKDGQVVREDGFFVGYNLLVWITILLQVLGGLTVAMCVAQMDNIIKNFAVSISIVFSFLIEVYFFDTSITINFVFGASTVILAIYLYGRRTSLLAS